MTTSRKRKAPGRAQSQEERRAMGNRVITSITLSPEALEALDKLKGKESRGVFIEELIFNEANRG